MRFDNIFSSSMVFAKGQPIRIYGTGEGDAEIEFADKKQKFTAENGKWFVEFPALDYGGPYTILLTTNTEKIVLDDVYVGDVYLFGGQSNMQFKIKEGKEKGELCETNEMLRLFSPDRIEKTDLYTPKDGWVKAEKNMAPEWSAIAHYAGIKLAKETNRAIGIIVCYQGASVIESWVPKDIFEQNGISIATEDKGYSHHSGPYSIWNHNGQLYEYMISQIAPFSLSGVVWYQGESDATLTEAKVYDKELAILIDSWRKAFKNSELPFVVIQIADYDNATDSDGWRLIQQMQYDIQFKVPNVTTIISADVSDSDDIHPPKKYALSQKIAHVLLGNKPY